jgi:hypothetical protein
LVLFSTKTNTHLTHDVPFERGAMHLGLQRYDAKATPTRAKRSK